MLWDLCQDRFARQAALRTIAWIDSKVSSPQADALKAAILNGFGAGAASGDFVTGVFVPGTTQRFTTSNSDATLELQGDAFTVPTLITIRRLSNAFRLTGFPALQQKPPFYDYDATNSLTDNTVETHKPKPGSAVMAFCFEPPDADYGSPGASIGHNPVGGGFELVQEVPVPPALQEELSACNSSEVGSVGKGLPGLGRYLGAMAQHLFLPEPLQATTVGGRGPIAGTPISLSPFGLVLVSLNRVTLSANDPGDIEGSYSVGQTLDTCGEGCTPRFSVTHNESLVTTPTQLLVTLVAENGEPGKLNGTRVRTTSGPDWIADFDDLSVTEPGTYHLVVSAPGATFYTTRSFHVTNSY